MRILVLPHVGTTFGHLVRTLEYIAKFHPSDDVTIVVPNHSVELVKRSRLPHLKVVIRDSFCSITNLRGHFNVSDFTKVLADNAKIFLDIMPELLIGDPGMQAGLLSLKYGCPWIGLMHGCYLPAPQFDKKDNCVEVQLLRQLKLKIDSVLNKLVEIGSSGDVLTWHELISTGRIKIPGSYTTEPSSIGEYVDLGSKGVSWKSGKKVNWLITTSTGDAFGPSARFINKIARYIGSNVWVRSEKGFNEKYEDNIVFFGSDFHYQSLTSDQTTVITHGGHGTLRSISEAQRVIIIPGDLDQLYNGLLANITRGWELVLDRNWYSVVLSASYLKREIYWDNIHIQKCDFGLRFSGICQEGKELTEVFYDKMLL